MCYNKTTSISAFIFGMIFTFLLISKKKYNYALFNSAIVFMQLIEYFGHISLENKNNQMNTLIAGCILTLVFLQPIIYIYAFYSKNDFQNNNTLLFAILLFLTIYLVFLYFLYHSNQLNISYFKHDCINYCRMNWSFFGKYLYLSIPFCIMYFYLFNSYIPTSTIKQKFNYFFIYSLVLSILYMVCVDHFKGIENYYSGFGSIFCIFSVIYGPVAYFYG